ncbi:LytR family transcriptional regulator [Streptomyces sp. 150FB]|uniref:LCP family protein n=1 Tax=Streptomyces sp. 150FB TaxID=1576605 RepID=UPI000588E9ED|nr:LCP family protein [Streptomyces sp. 150FB]KIF74717.1 LytR family transcriptional regulator [Streptomyces sp. 150FB]
MRVATTVSVVVLGAGGIGHALVTSLDTGIDRVDLFKDMKNRPDAGHGMNFLLVGTDGRDKITAAEKAKYRLGGAPCHCTDTIMLVHLSEDGRRASVVSLPRDSYAELPEHTDETTGKGHKPHAVKINAAYAEGGPGLTVRTVEHMTGVKISHYLEIDFTSFMKTVDALGGVDICTPKPLKDSYTGLDLSPGTHNLDGGEALQYVRSRHLDAASDLGRMQRQQRFVAALINKATGSGVLLNPVKFRHVTSAVLGSVRADPGFGTEQLLRVNEAMRGFSPSSSEFTSVPLTGSGSGVMVKGLGSTVKWDPVKAQRLFTALREDRPLTAPHRPAPGPKAAAKATVVEVKPQDITVRVYNGTRSNGLGKRVDDALRAAGFRSGGAPLTSRVGNVRRTVVMYDPGWDRSAKSLAAALPGSELRPVAGQGGTMKVIAGTDFRAVTPVRAEVTASAGQFGAVTGDQVVCP